MLTKPLILHLQSVELTDDQFYYLWRANDDLKFERTAKGRINHSVREVSGNRESDLNGPVWLWNKQTNLGKVFSSSTMFRLPNGSDRSPDIAWVRLERWNALSPEEQEKFPPICPDFVIELRSQTNSLEALHEKMQE